MKNFIINHNSEEDLLHEVIKGLIGQVKQCKLVYGITT
jgi:hypothetical protein